MSARSVGTDGYREEVSAATDRPGPPGPVQSLQLFWRWLRRMRTALYLLGVLGVATFVATLIPQRNNVPQTVDEWLTSGGASELGARALDALGMFDVYGTPWFAVLLGLLFTSLTACLVPRYRAFWRTVRRGRPPRALRLEDKQHVARIDAETSPDAALAVARRILGLRRYRLRSDEDTATEPAAVRSDAREGVVEAPADDTVATHVPRPARRDQVAGERGHVAREGGSLIFHTSFYLLLLGIIAGQLADFRGQVGVVEGEAFADTQVSYWTTDSGRWWDAHDHRGFVLTLDRFDVDWTPGGMPIEFRSHVTVDPRDGREPYRDSIRVNDPLVIDGMKIHQLDWGYAARVIVRDGGELVHDAVVPLLATSGGYWRGAVKAPAARPQVGLELFLYPNAPANRRGRVEPTGSPRPDAPYLILQMFEGDLQLERAQNVFELDTRALREVGGEGLRPGEPPVRMPHGVTVEFRELRQWSGLQVSRRPTDGVLLVAAALLLLGLLPALYAYRRRIWVEAVADPVTRRTVVTIAGHAFQRPQSFEREFDALVDEIAAPLTAARRLDQPADGARQETREVVRR